MIFPCTKCGICCRHIAKVLPEYDGGNGVCIYLDKDNLCEIYSDRPLVCNIDKIYNKLFSGRMDQEEFYKITERACTLLQKSEV